ncbi:MAG: NfeD family protein [Bermanella sp.]|jgi:Membrane protein implicated in regulation of membrane protease activity
MENEMWAWLEQLSMWHWFILGLVLLMGEAFGAAGFLLGAAMAALLTGVLVWLAAAVVEGGMGWQGQILSWTVLAIVCSLWYWKKFRASAQESERPELNQRSQQLIGRKLTLSQDVDFSGRIQIGDTFWKVKSDQSLHVGDKVEVVAADVSTLTIVKLD